MTRVNMDFVHDVNYQGLFHLKDAIVQGKPAGLRDLDGDHSTVYAALASLPEGVRRSWFAFEHFCSAQAFQEALPLVFERPVRRLLDVGANTGKWALACAAHSPSVAVTMCDLPAQLDLAIANVAQSGLQARITGYPVDILLPDSTLPSGHDVIWMSQFLDCFSEDQIVSILRKAAAAMSAESKLLILETYWDRQLFENAAFCLQQISLYFTCIANGNSQLYHSKVMHDCIERAGLRIERETDHIGIAHTLTVCVKR
jgi:cyclopropane fatty-acyl-phospholipid synthase-like methyltransferase